MQKGLEKLGNALTTIRVWTVNLLTLAFVLYLLVILYAVLAQRGPDIDPEGRVLIIAPEGLVVDQAVFVSPLAFPPDPDTPAQLQARDLLRVIRAATEDDRLKGVLIDFSKTTFGGPSTALEIAGALAELRATDTPVIAYSDVLSTGGYLMAAQADEVYMHPSGALMLSGIGGYGSYVRQLAEKLKLTIHNYAQGDYKSAVERLARDSMSENDREQRTALFDPIWAAMKQRMASGRNIDPTVFQQLADDYPVLLLEEAAYENLAFAEQQGAIDGTKTFPSFRAWMMERFGTDEEAERETYPHISAAAYLAQLEDPNAGQDAAVAVVFAEGGLQRGEVQPGVAGSDEIASQVRRAYEDDSTRAIVVRVNSPGGSVIASDMIREEMMAAQGRDLPVVVSMGNYAASGGMWVSSPADRIFAAPTTITGSIGVAVVFPTAENLFDYLGIQHDGVTTSKYAGWGLHRPTDEELDRIFFSRSETIYRRFIDVVAEGRELEVPFVTSIAGGRVWIGTTAQELGLVDELGSLDDAIAHAAGLAELEGYRVNYIQRELSFGERLLADMMRKAPVSVDSGVQDLYRQVEAVLAPLVSASQPRVTVMCTSCVVDLN
ncbi:MAG: signal peptide peptidase SppA [Halieaceae bacterium]|jgi:protease-4|nr:signal peptide peptidase SppA [Halieaceae bacterium]